MVQAGSNWQQVVAEKYHQDQSELSHQIGHQATALTSSLSSVLSAADEPANNEKPFGE